MKTGLSDKEIIDAMARAGIPKHYRDKTMNLGTQGYKGELCNWLQNTARDDVLAGQGKFIVTKESILGMDVFYLLARQLLVRGVAVYVAHILDLIDGIEKNKEELDDFLEHTHALFVLHFYNDGYKEWPLTNERRLNLQRLLSDRMLDHKAIFFEANQPPRDCNWWDRWFLEQVQQHTGKPHFITK